MSVVVWLNNPQRARLVWRMTNPICRAALYYFLLVYFKGLLQTLKLYAGHPQDLVKCNAEFDVSIIILVVFFYFRGE